MKSVLVVGGAGYIGSHMVKLLSSRGENVIVSDDLSTGYQAAILGGQFERGSIADGEYLDGVFARHRIDVVMHFASLIQVGESVLDPAKYYRNNVTYTLNLLDAMVRHGVGRFVFSSSAAVYGEPQASTLREDHPRLPLNPYGNSKKIVEDVLADYERAYGLKSVCLRYFNAAGADPEGDLGERHEPETHLIPLVLQAASGRRPSITVFGQDFDTKDGTCIRDFVHVVDLCDAHLLALAHLRAGGESKRYNLGNGEGFSVREVIDVAMGVTGRRINVQSAGRREGDPARLVADSRKVRAELGWVPSHAELAAIIEHAWQWELKKGKRW
jgi:UDP-glucose 4-epimerase